MNTSPRDQSEKNAAVVWQVPKTDESSPGPMRSVSCCFLLLAEPEKCGSPQSSFFMFTVLAAPPIVPFLARSRRNSRFCCPPATPNEGVLVATLVGACTSLWMWSVIPCSGRWPSNFLLVQRSPGGQLLHL